MSPTPTLHLRALAPGDIDRVHAIEVAASPDPWSRQLLANELDGTGADRHWLVATTEPAGQRAIGDEVSSQIIGFGGVLQVLDEAHIMNLVVDPTWRRQGVASRLLATLLLDIGDRGAIAATLEVRAGNRPAIELYRAFGFEQAGRRPRYYADGEDAEIMWCHRIDRPARRDHFGAMATGGDSR